MTRYEMCDTVAKKCLPLYKKLFKEMQLCLILRGDETGWFVNGKRWWVWVFVSKDAILYHISTSRSKTVAEAILKDFTGIVISDSYSGWNDVGTDHQRCLLHYHRNMYETLDENKSKQFKKLFKELYDIFKTAVQAWQDHGTDLALADKLQKRLDKIIKTKYTDDDCKRFVKRLKRESKQLLTFLRHEGVEYHNNASERAVRPLSLQRKILYGNRSKRGVEITEVSMSIDATCRLRGILPEQLFEDLLNDTITDMPKASKSPKLVTKQQKAPVKQALAA